MSLQEKMKFIENFKFFQNEKKNREKQKHLHLQYRDQCPDYIFHWLNNDHKIKFC